MGVATQLTEEEFLNLPEFAGRQEFRDGELIELPPAKKPHSELVKRIVKLLGTVLHESRIWSETGFQLRQGRWVVPDVAVTWPDQATVNGYFQRSPMVAIEVASRGNTPDQLQQKVLDYLDCGAAEVCVIYPKTRTMMIHRPGETQYVDPSADYVCQSAAGAVFTPEYRTEIEELAS